MRMRTVTVMYEKLVCLLFVIVHYIVLADHSEGSYSDLPHGAH